MIDPSPILALAPMAGITDWPMRLLCAEQGCNYTTTEMVSAMGYLTAPDSLYVYQYKSNHNIHCLVTLMHLLEFFYHLHQESKYDLIVEHTPYQPNDQ